jgi:hypothetical protein
MDFGLLRCDPLSVGEVIRSSDLDGQYVGVHGIVFYGDGCADDEFLLLPKEGPFDGVGPIPMPDVLDRSRCLLIEERDLDNRLGGSSVVGAFRYKHDAIVVGQIRRWPGTDHPVRIGNLWLIVMQHWLDLGYGPPSRDFRVIAFSGPLPALPWRGFQGERHVSPIVRVDPPRDQPVAQ